MLCNKKQWKTILLSSLGGGLEYYDFVIFIIFAKYIGENFSFSHQESEIAQLFFAFSLFAVGYLARPLGGLLFSHLGDKFGRKKAFSLSISIMAMSTLFMGLLPSYQSIGITATIIFTLLRIAQGLSLGGEVPGAITFLKEHCHEKPGLACGILFFCVNTGIILADGVNSVLVYFFSPEQLMSWGWRIAFYIGSSLAILAYFMRKSLEETPDFLKCKQDVQKIPVLTLLKNYPDRVVVGFLVSVLPSLSVTLLLLYINSYLQMFHYSPELITHISLINAMSLSCFVILFGILADKWGYHKLLGVGAFLFLGLTSYAYQQIVNHGEHMILLLSILSIFAGCAMIASVLVLAHIFPVNVRYSGVAFCYNINMAVFGGLSPLIATFLIQNKGMMTAPALLLQAGAVLALLGMLACYYGKNRFLRVQV